MIAFRKNMSWLKFLCEVINSTVVTVFIRISNTGILIITQFELRPVILREYLASFWMWPRINKRVFEFNSLSLNFLSLTGFFLVREWNLMSWSLYLAFKALNDLFPGLVKVLQLIPREILRDHGEIVEELRLLVFQILLYNSWHAPKFLNC